MILDDYQIIMTIANHTFIFDFENDSGIWFAICPEIEGCIYRGLSFFQILEKIEIDFKQ